MVTQLDPMSDTQQLRMEKTMTAAKARQHADNKILAATARMVC
jgi:hypothetical protein